MDSVKRKNAAPENPGAQLFELATSFMKSRAVCMAARLGIADLIHDGVQHSEELAKYLNVNKDALARLLRALTSIGVFQETSPQHFELTPMSMALLSDSPLSLKYCLSMMGDRSWWLPWGKLNDAIQSGHSTIHDALGMDYDSYLLKNPETLNIFQKCLATMAKVNNPALLQSFDFSAFSKIVDVGCGNGDLLVDILQAQPQSSGILFDVKPVVDHINLDDAHLADRCQKTAGNFFQAVPPGGDLYLLKQILHDWNDEHATIILRHCAKAMKVDSRLLIIETVLSGKVNPIEQMACFFDLHMLVTSEGRERSISDFKTLLEKASFDLKYSYQTSSSFTILECGKK